MSHRDLRSARRGRDFEHLLVTALIGLIALGTAAGVVTQIILPAFERVGDAFELAADPERPVDAD